MMNVAIINYNRIGWINVSKWFYINAIVLFYAGWKIFTGNIGIHIIFGALGLLLFFYNWSRHAFYDTIRSDISRADKIKYAKLSMKFGKNHQWTGTFALIFIIGHGGLVLYQFGLQLTNLKVMSGLLAGITLAGVVFFGWLRKHRVTVIRRYIHLSLAISLFAFILLHLVL